jgi:lipid-A-disaccharide synthase
MMVLYKVRKIDYLIVKYILRVNLKYISIPNIIMDEMLYPEFYQTNLDAEIISDRVLDVMNNKKINQVLRDKLSMLREKLGNYGVLENVAKSIVEMVDKS